jgi:DNA-binding NarL/FixJ family response regulator
MREGIRMILAAEPDLQLVGEAADVDQAQRLSRALQPDVILLDLSMPGPAPIETVAALCRLCPGVKVLVLTTYDDAMYTRGVLAVGAAGYVLKDEATEVLALAIRRIL